MSLEKEDEESQRNRLWLLPLLLLFHHHHHHFLLQYLLLCFSISTSKSTIQCIQHLHESEVERLDAHHHHIDLIDWTSSISLDTISSLGFIPSYWFSQSEIWLLVAPCTPELCVRVKQETLAADLWGARIIIIRFSVRRLSLWTIYSVV